MKETMSRSQTGLSPKKELVLKAKKKKKVIERGFPASMIHGKDGDKNKKYQLLCSCNTEKDAWDKSKRKIRTQPVLAYKIDPKLRSSCEICHVPPHIVMKTADVKAIDKAFEDAN